MSETPVQTAAAPKGYFASRVLSVHHWTEKLFSFKVERDPSFRFEAGQFIMIGLMVDGKPLVRAYSMASTPFDEHLEFFSIKVPDGPLTSRLQKIVVGDTVLVGKKPTGTLLIHNLNPGKRLYLLATGTGFAPFASIIRHPDTYERFENVIVAYGCREKAELGYASETIRETKDSEYLGELAGPQLHQYMTVTREAYEHQGRVTTAIENGELFKALGVPTLNPDDDRVMICGNPEMLVELRDMLLKRGFTEGNSGEPGNFVIEKAFVEK